MGFAHSLGMRTSAVQLALLLCFGVGVLAFPFPTAFAGPHLYLRRPSFQKIVKAEPKFSEFAHAAYRHQELTEARLRAWQKRAAKAALLPKLYVGYDHSFKEGESLSITDNISVTSSGVTIGPEDNDIDYDQNLGQVIRVRAVWDLNKVVFNRDSLAVSNQRFQLYKLRRELSDSLYDLYEKRYLYLKEYFRLRGRAPNKAKSFYLKYELLTDRLDEITGGRFTDQLWRKS